MKEQKKLKIYLALNAIAVMLDDASFRKIKDRLDEIAEAVAQEPLEETTIDRKETT